MVFAGILAGETLVGFLLVGVYYIIERLALAAAVNGKLAVDADPEKHLAFMPRWRMFFAFVFGLAILVGTNIAVFVKFGGLEACDWSGFDVAFRYIVDYYGLFAVAASPVGWVLAVTFSLLPLVVRSTSGSGSFFCSPAYLRWCSAGSFRTLACGRFLPGRWR